MKPSQCSRHVHRTSGTPPRKRLSGPESGFSRPDLIALIVGLGALFVVLLPTLGQAGAKSVRVRCADNLRTVGRAFRSFALDHDRLFPMQIPSFRGGTQDYVGTGDTSNGHETWRHFRVLEPYLSTPRLLACPADSGRRLAATFSDMERALVGRNVCISYGLGVGALDAVPRMVLAADRSLNWPGGHVPLQYNSNTGLRGNIGTNAESLRTLEWDARGMHADGGNTLRVDGSVHLMDSARLRQAFMESGDSRNNYAQPGRGSN